MNQRIRKKMARLMGIHEQSDRWMQIPSVVRFHRSGASRRLWGLVTRWDAIRRRCDEMREAVARIPRALKPSRVVVRRVMRELSRAWGGPKHQLKMGRRWRASC